VTLIANRVAFSGAAFQTVGYETMIVTVLAVMSVAAAACAAPARRAASISPISALRVE
jgi:ABC-type lipoprotein release transport system permease subunit